MGPGVHASIGAASDGRDGSTSDAATVSGNGVRRGIAVASARVFAVAVAVAVLIMFAITANSADAVVAVIGHAVGCYLHWFDKPHLHSQRDAALP